MPKLDDLSRRSISHLRSPLGSESVANTANVGEIGDVGRTSSSGDISTFVGVGVGDGLRGERRSEGGRTASRTGFAMLSKMTAKTKKGIAAAAIGFALLLPFGAGQIMHPGIAQPTVKSPLAMQLVQKSEISSGAAVRSEVQRARSQIPGGGGAAQEDGVTRLVKVSLKADNHAKAAGAMMSNAAHTMDELKSHVGFDAKLGWAADVYWFGVPSENLGYHQGSDDLKAVNGFGTEVQAAAGEARAAARGEVSNLLYAQDGQFHQTRDHFDVVHAKYTAAQTIAKLAGKASSALSSAQTAITLRNLTPKTVSVDDYTTRTTRNRDGTTSSERVKTGSHTETNPAYTTANLLAVAAKASAESAVHELNGAITASRAILPDSELGAVHANLIGFLDFFGQPSFLIWSFDSSDVSKAQSKVTDMHAAADRLVGQIAPEHARLDQSIQHSIDIRWGSLLDGARPGS